MEQVENLSIVTRLYGDTLMPRLSFEEGVEKITKVDRRFHSEAYFFIRDALDFTIKMVRKQSGRRPSGPHVSGTELVEGIRRFALQSYGPMTLDVMAYWGVTRCEHYGELVFNLIDVGLFGRTENDTREDFRRGFDFEEAFVKPFAPTPPASPATSPAPRAAGIKAGKKRPPNKSQQPSP